MQKYLHYTFEDWIMDDGFVAYAKGQNPAFEQVLQQVCQEAPTQKEQIDEAKLFLESISDIEEKPHSISEDALWAKIDAQTVTEAKVVSMKPQPTRKNRWWQVAAAVAVLILGALWFLNPLSNKVTIETARAEQKTFALPDGSEVDLNAMSKIVFNENNWAEKRALTLEGEAFFSVKKGATFTVKTDKGTVEVLGTRFNVSTFEGFQVACEEGKVRVSSSGKKLELTANESATLKENTLEKGAINVEQTIAWKAGKYYFENQTLETVVSALERQFDLKINLDNEVKQRKFSGVLSKQQAVEELVQTVCWPLNLNFEETNTGFRIYESKE